MSENDSSSAGAFVRPRRDLSSSPPVWPSKKKHVQLPRVQRLQRLGKRVSQRTGGRHGDVSYFWFLLASLLLVFLVAGILVSWSIINWFFFF